MTREFRRLLLVGATLAGCAVSMALHGQESKPASAKEPPLQGSGGRPAAREKEAAPARPRIQVALLLDTSSSMQGLIRQAKTELWKMVNEFVLARKGGQSPDFEVALYEYGNKTLGAPANYLRQVAPLTDNLDKVSEDLSSLRIMSHGSQEYCGAVIRAAAKDLAWSDSREDLKVIFIAGNESFSQGGVDYRQACKEAITRDVIVNTIYCGSYGDGVGLGWKDGARRADGAYASIDQNRTVVRRAAPQDKELLGLNARLNDTYVPYGARGNAGKDRQVEQDRIAESSPGAALGRTVSKASRFYKSASWDLVDALSQKLVKLTELKDKDLPEVMRKMNADVRKRYVEGKAKERQTIQGKIQALNEQRRKHVAELAAKEKEKGAAGKPSSEKSLGAAVTAILREQAARKKFEFKKPVKPTQPLDE